MEGQKSWVFLWTLGMSLGETYPKFSPKTTRNKLLKFQHYKHKK
jgi:hypothetical protein